jgi:LruC domain-containing protein
MKKLVLIIILSLFGIFGYSQKMVSIVINDFEDGNWNYYSNLCWGIGPNSNYFNTKVTGNGFNGTDVCETDNLGHSSPCILESPWIDLNEGEITFDHAVPSFNGNRKLSMYLVDINGNTTTLWSFVYQNSSSKSAVKYNTITGIYKIRWKWEGSSGNSRCQLDNIIIPGSNVSDPSNNCNIYVPPVIDTIYNYYPASDTSTLVFEDLWPSYGDYDMNDLVIGYKFKITSYQNKIYDIYATFIVRANGAGLSNGFGFQLPIQPLSVVSVTGFGEQVGYSISSNGTENNQTNATFIVFDDTHKFMSAWNTIKGKTTCPWVTFNLHIKLNGTLTLQQINIQNWNPFIIVNNTRGHEVHLPNYQPTDLMDFSLFGTHDDDTQPSIGKYYKSINNLPWALNIYGKFDYPVEKSDISSAYLHFQDWVLSNGTQYQNWWLNTSSGYRNNNLIY